MEDVRNLRIPTRDMMYLLLHLYFNKTCTFKSQNIYNDQQHFWKVIKKLHKWNVIDKKQRIINGRFKPYYILNGNGIIFIKEFIYDYHKRTE